MGWVGRLGQWAGLAVSWAGWPSGGPFSFLLFLLLFILTEENLGNLIIYDIVLENDSLFVHL